MIILTIALAIGFLVEAVIIVGLFVDIRRLHLMCQKWDMLYTRKCAELKSFTAFTRELNEDSTPHGDN